MRCILRKETDPYFNIAAEEFVMRNLHEDIFMLWRNDPAVIIGKHQNAFAEINHDFVKRKQIKVIRRISGGGTVYHDHGNLNFTFVSHGEINHLVDFHKFTLPIIQTLGKLGLKVAVGARNNLFIDGNKISGNAEHVFKNKVLHHGTLLFSSDLNVLDKAIKPPLLKYEDKAVKSVRSKVANITDYLENEMTIEEFAQFIMYDISHTIPDAYLYSFTAHELAEINKLKETKYATWEWNYGYSPQFSFPTTLSVNNSECPVIVKVKDGVIEDIFTEDSVQMAPAILELIKQIKGLQLTETVISKKLKSICTPADLMMILHSLFAGGPAEHLQSVNV